MVSTIPELPIAEKIEEITKALRSSNVLIVSGDTGSGKSTQLPKLLLQMGKQSIGVTEPRRMATRALAERIALELNTPLGEVVGYQIRFRKALSANTRIKVMTDGVLLAEWLNSPLFGRYDALMIDEAHERSLNIDLLLGALKDVLQKRDDLTVVIASATLNAELFARHFKAPVVTIAGRSYPVEIIHEPVDEDLYESIAKAVSMLPDDGHILVFCPASAKFSRLKKDCAAVFRIRKSSHFTRAWPNPCKEKCLPKRAHSASSWLPISPKLP